MSTGTTAPDTSPDGDGARDVRPIVAGSRRSLAVPLFIGAMVIVAVVLFSALNARRQALTAPDTRPHAGMDIDGESRVPDLFIPPEIDRDRLDPLTVERIEPVTAEGPPAPPRREPVTIVQAPAASPPTLPSYDPEPSYQDRPSTPGRILVYDRSSAGQNGEGEASVAAARSPPGPARARADRLSNPSTTVIQGTVIPAVLETALDTTRPGQARAVVTQNVYGFDGSRVLIPRGSRLIGVYQSDLTGGQNRVLVAWTRLIRPDGATIALDSQSADRLGRAGIRGEVDSHFWERVGATLFRTTLDVGALVAAQELSSGTGILYFPDSLRRAGEEGTRDAVQRTLRVRQGAPVSVFVSRDLDFSPVESGR